MSSRSWERLRRTMRRVGRAYRSVGRGLRVRYPYFSVLRPVSIVGWLLGTSILSAILAYRFRGTLYQPLDPRPLTIAWLLPSIGVAILWVFWQGRERSRLPSTVAIPRIWSFLPTFLSILVILAPSFIWEQIAYNAVRTLMSRDDARLLLAVSRDGTIKEWNDLYRPLPEHYAWLKAQGQGWMDDEHDRPSAAYYRCRILFTDMYPELRHRLDADGMDLLAHFPIEILPSEYRSPALPVIEKHKNYCNHLILDEDDKDNVYSSGSRSYNFIEGNVVSSVPEWAAIYNDAYDVGQAEGSTYWKDDETQKLFLLLTAAVAVFVGFIGVIPFDRALIGMTVHLLFIVCFVFIGPVLNWSLGSSLKNFIGGVFALWRRLGFPSAALLVSSLVLQQWPSNQRSSLGDKVYAAMWSMPFAVLNIETVLLGIGSLSDQSKGPLNLLISRPIGEWIDYRKGFTHVLLDFFLVYAFLSIFSPAALTRYRNLPYDE